VDQLTIEGLRELGGYIDKLTRSNPHDLLDALKERDELSAENERLRSELSAVDSEAIRLFREYTEAINAHPPTPESYKRVTKAVDALYAAARQRRPKDQ
jgi:predicted DNA-binding transcriptional regulator YafY